MRQKLIQIYKGDQFVSSGIKPSKKKVIVFDLDETIGSFADLEILWNSLGEFDFFKQNQDSFNALLDLYPEFFRYGILNILDFLHYKKTKGHCYKLFTPLNILIGTKKRFKVRHNQVYVNFGLSYNKCMGWLSRQR